MQLPKDVPRLRMITVAYPQNSNFQIRLLAYLNCPNFTILSGSFSIRLFLSSLLLQPNYNPGHAKKPSFDQFLRKIESKPLNLSFYLSDPPMAISREEHTQKNAANDWADLPTCQWAPGFDEKVVKNLGCTQTALRCDCGRSSRAQIRDWSETHLQKWCPPPPWLDVLCPPGSNINVH